MMINGTEWDHENERGSTSVPNQTKILPGRTYKVLANITGSVEWHTVVRRPLDDKPGIYYVEADFHDYYYEDDDWNSEEVQLID